MAPRRGPGSRVQGAYKRVSKKGKEEVKAQQQQKTQQALRLTKAAGESKQVAVARMKSAASSGSENLTAINQEALVELNQHLLSFPRKILILLRMAQKEEFFKEASTLPGDWLHATLIYVKSAGKANIKEAILMYAKEKKLNWSMELLTKADKANDLKGIEMISCYLAGMDWNDYLPKKMHYKPLFKKVLCNMFSKSTGNVVIHPKTGALTFEPPVYELSSFDGTANKYMDIKHNPTGKTVKISEDLHVTDKNWHIQDAWSTFHAALRGRTITENVYGMFEEANNVQDIEYDTDAVFDSTITEVLDSDPDLQKTLGDAEKELEAFEAEAKIQPSGASKPSL